MPTNQILNALLKYSAIVLLGVMLFLIRDIILVIFISVIIAAAVKPLVNRLEDRRIPRGVSTLAIFTVLAGIGSVILYALIPPLIEQSTALITRIPSLSSISVQTFGLDRIVGKDQAGELVQQGLNSLKSLLSSAPSSLLDFGLGVVNSLFTVFTVLVLTFYLIAERNVFKNFLVDLARSSAAAQTRIANVVDQVELKLGAWVRGQLFLMVFVGVLTYIGLSIIGVEYALPLAILTGLLDIIPLIGSTVAAIPAILVAAAISPGQALIVTVLYVFIQQLEGNVLVPKIMNQAVGLNAILVILALMVGSKLGGPIGALISVPSAAIVAILYEEWQSSLKPQNPNTEIQVSQSKKSKVA